MAMPGGPEMMAEQFHEAYERLASFNYKTRKASAVPWTAVPEQNKQLMIEVCREMMGRGWRNDDG
jgi:hypothetical protein